MKTDIKNKLIDESELYEIQHEEQSTKKSHLYLRFGIYTVAGFCFSQLDALGDMSPFTLSFLSAINFDYCFGVFIASSMGYFLSKPWQTALKYTLSSAFMCILRRIIAKRLSKQSSATAKYIACFASSAITGLIFSAFTGFNYISVFMVICESLLSLCASVFFIISFRTPVLKTGISSLSVKDSSSLVLSFCVFLMCMSGFSIEGLSPARILSCLILMFLSFYKGSAAGSVAGVCIGAALCIDPSYRYLFPCYALSRENLRGQMLFRYF